MIYFIDIGLWELHVTTKSFMINEFSFYYFLNEWNMHINNKQISFPIIIKGIAFDHYCLRPNVLWALVGFSEKLK